MSEGHLLAIDVGTGSCRAVLFTPEGRQAGIGQRGVQPSAGTGRSRLSGLRHEGELVPHRRVRAGGARLRLGQSRPVRAVSATSMREGMVLYDAGGEEIWACPNVDSRAGEEAAELVASGEAEQIYDRAGDWVSITAPARFRWIARHDPDVFARIAHVGMLGDWVLEKLSGHFVTDPSLGSSSGMFDLARRDWSDTVLGICGLERGTLPPVAEAGTVIGAVTAVAAEETGLAQGTPVVVGGADTQLGLLGIGVTRPGRFTIVGGSFWQHTCCSTAPPSTPRRGSRTLCHATPGLWMMEGIGFYCGIVMRWFRDAFCELEQAEAAALGVDTYSIMEHKASAVPPGSHGVVGLFSNVMQASRWVHTTPGFLGFDVDNPQQAGRAECFRSIEESAAYVSLAHLRIIEDVTGRPVDEAILTGGAPRAVCGRRSSPTPSASPSTSLS